MIDISFAFVTLRYKVQTDDRDFLCFRENHIHSCSCAALPHQCKYLTNEKKEVRYNLMNFITIKELSSTIVTEIYSANR